MFQREGGILICQACRFFCRLEEERASGRCGVRHRRGDRVQLDVRIRVSEVEPVERRGFFHLAPGATVWSYWTGSSGDGQRALETFPSRGVMGIAAADPEAAWAFEHHAQLARQAREQGLAVLWNSRGLWSSPVLGLVPSLATAVRLILDADNREKWGKILYEGAWLRSRDVWVEVALVPPNGLSPRDLRHFLKTFRETLTPETPLHVVRSFSPRTPAATLIQIAETLGEMLPYVYVDHLPGNPRENTFCPHCEAPLVYRFGWVVLENRMKDGRCPECHKPIPGRWTLS